MRNLDHFIEREIKPLERENDNIRFFDHRREWARTDFERGGLPRHEWEALLGEMRRRADQAGHYRFALPKEYGGKDGSNLAMAIIREHLAAKGLGLHNDLQNESSIVGNLPTVLMFRDFGTKEQHDAFIPGILDGSISVAFGLTEPNHGSDATWMETRGEREGDGWRINGEKIWNTGLHVATHDFVFARTSGRDGGAKGITCFIVPTKSDGFKIEEYLVDLQHADRPSARLAQQRLCTGRRDARRSRRTGWRWRSTSSTRTVFGRRPRRWARRNICINESVKYAQERKPFGKPLATNQAIQWPLVELQTEAAMIRALIHQTAWEMDQMSKPEVARRLSDKVAMCNYRANRLVCEAADRAMQVHGGMGYSRHKPFEHIYRHHRRYRITEGAEEIQMRRVAQILFGFGSRGKSEE